MAEPARAWTVAFPSTEILPGGCRVFRAGADRVAVFRSRDGGLHAVDDRCPHEGYPLSQGEIRGRVLTCKWHNYKFDLRDGRCLLGEEAVRSFAVQEVDGFVEVDLAPPDPDKVRASARANLLIGLREVEMGMVARDVVRLLLAGEPPEAIAVLGAIHDARHARYGTTHALPVAADILHWLPRYAGPRAAIPLVQALDVASLPNARRPVRPRPDPVDPGDDPDLAGARLRALVEGEQADAAEALFRGALARGWGPTHAGPWLFSLCADHFLDFGHGLIFTVKALDLLEATGWEPADEVLPALLHGIVVGTREDTLPGWGGFNERVAALQPSLDALYRRAHRGPVASASTTGVAGPPTTGTVADALAALDHHLLQAKAPTAVDAVVDALAAGASLRDVLDRLSVGAAERMLRFDIAHDRDPESHDGWLDVTHMVTFAAAVRQACEAWQDPQALRLVLQAARFVSAGRVLDRDAEDRADTERAMRAEHPVLEGRLTIDVPDLLCALAEQSADEAIALTARWLADRPDPEPLRAALMDLAVADPAVRPILVAHVVKLTVAAFDEYRVTADPRPILALVRLLASPRSERRIRRATDDAIRLLVEGKVPRRRMP